MSQTMFGDRKDGKDLERWFASYAVIPWAIIQGMFNLNDAELRYLLLLVSRKEEPSDKIWLNVTGLSASTLRKVRGSLFARGVLLIEKQPPPEAQPIFEMSIDLDTFLATPTGTVHRWPIAKTTRRPPQRRKNLAVDHF